MEKIEIEKIVEIVNQFELCKFVDKLGHSLENNILFFDLITLAKHYFSPKDGDKDTCKICGCNFRDIRFHIYSRTDFKEKK